MEAVEQCRPEMWKTTLRAEPGRNPTFRRVGGGRARTSPPPTAWLFTCSQALSGHPAKFARRDPPAAERAQGERASHEQHLDAEFSGRTFCDFTRGQSRVAGHLEMSHSIRLLPARPPHALVGGFAVGYFQRRRMVVGESIFLYVLQCFFRLSWPDLTRDGCVPATIICMVRDGSSQARKPLPVH